MSFVKEPDTVSILILKILLVTWMANVVSSVFFHEPSATLLKTEDGIDFGFSMGFQKGNKTLVISAPLENNTMHSSRHTIGKVFTCPVSDINDIECAPANIDVKNLSQYNIDGINPNQNFLLGASIATTRDYFLTCAPLWSSTISRPHFVGRNFSFGTCFTYNGTAHRYLGYPELFERKNLTYLMSTNSFEGGIGWNTLVDEDNDLILIAKPFSFNFNGQIYYLDTKKPLARVKNVEFRENRIQNFGFGMAAGKFFSNENSYAISVQDFAMIGTILFLEKDHKNGLKTKCAKEAKEAKEAREAKDKCQQYVKIYNNQDVGSMFGYTVAAADINGDEYTELIVGAPAHQDETIEYGAVHIYPGGSVETMRKGRKTILGDVEGSRFGMAIATSDIDGDDIPEIIVGAPYEGSGKGAVYIISGHKVNETFFATSTIQVQVSKLEPQKIQKSDFTLFGYSLQVIEDLDANGYNELAIGSPGSSTVVLLRSLQAIKANVGLSTYRQKISDKDKEFDVEVCIFIEFNKKATYLKGIILVNNFAHSNGVKLDSSKFYVDLSKIYEDKLNQFCQNVSVPLKYSDVGFYTFNTEIEMSGLKESLKDKDFNKTVAVFSSHSETNESIEIERRCDDDDCIPKLSMMHVIWSTGSEYIIGSSENETLTVTVRNDGFNAYGVCVDVVIKSAQVLRTLGDCRDMGESYRCRLRNPLRRNTSETIVLELDMMTSITNRNKSLEMKVLLFEDCNNVTFSNDSKLIIVDYKLDANFISLTSESPILDITDKILSDEATETLNVNQVYLINNTGKLKWLDLDVVITFNKAEFEFSVKETAGLRNCSKLIETGYELKCKVDLEPDYVTKVILGIEMNKESIGKYIRTVESSKIESVMSLSRTPETTSLISRSESIIKYNKDTSMGNNKLLLIIIGIVVALLLLGGLCFILYKNDFFQGQNKKKLEIAKATVRQKSIRKSTASQDSQRRGEDGSPPCDLEIVDDNAFEEPSTAASSKDSKPLIEDEAHEHNEDKH